MIPLIGTGLDGLVGSRFTELFGHKYDFTNLSLATGVDITDPAATADQIGQVESAIVIHLAAFTDVKKAFEETDQKDGLAWRVNVLGTQNIVAACQKHHKYLIHVSTDYVFDGQKKEPYTEEDEPRPIEWYGRTKWEAEKIVRASGVPHAVIRIAFPYRAEFAAKADLIAKIRNGLETKTLPPQFDDNLITPTLVDDIATVFDLFCDRRPTGVWHVVGSSPLASFDLASLVAKTFNLDSPVVSGSLTEYLKTTDRPYHRYLALSNAKLGQEFGYHMSTVEEGLNKITNNDPR